MSKNKSKTPPPAAASLSSFYFSSVPKEEPKAALETTEEPNAEPETAESNAEPETTESNAEPETAESNAEPETTESNAEPKTAESNAEPETTKPIETRESQEQSLAANANETTNKHEESPAIEDAQSSEVQQDSDKEYRTESISLIVTRSLYDDLKILTKLNNKKNSTNDLIIDILTEYTSRASNQEKIKLFREIFPTIGN